MSGEIVFLLILVSIVATAAALIVTRRLIARANFNRMIARFERDLASPRWSRAPHEPSAAERARGRDHASPRSPWPRRFPDQTA
jgi:hypothetical protein